MEKCRICLEFCENMCPLNEPEGVITLIDMLISLTKLKLNTENNMPSKICSFCRNKLTEAYNFKITIEKSEMLLNKSANIKKINFNNFDDIKNEIDCKPVVLAQKFYTESLIQNSSEIIMYNNTVIKRINLLNNDKKTQIMVTDFLNSVKVECDADFSEHSYENDIDYDSSSEYCSDSKQFKYKKKQVTIIKTSNNTRKEKKQLCKPIKPIYLNDVIIQHTDKMHVKRNTKGQHKKYKYAAQTSICPYCGKLLRSKYINIHMLQHTGDKSFKCDQCLKSFHTKQLLIAHLKKHNELRKFKCNLCIASFHCKVSLNTHMLVHSEERKHICNICNKAFKRIHALRRHELVHNFGKKAVQCELCPMTFNSKQNLKHHMRVHTGERPYKCEICSQPYSYKHDFNRHCLKKHGVFLKRRSVNIMNEEVLKQERALMRDLTLRAHGVIKGDIPSEYEGPQGALAFVQAMKAVEARQIPVNYIDTSHRL